MKNLLLLFFLSFAILVPHTAEASDFDYSIIQPGEGDLCLNQAQDIASLFFNQNNKMGYCLDSNNDRYSSVSHFICMNYSECSTNAWVISFIDETAEVKPESCFIGMVVVHSPTGKVLYFTDQNYWNALSTWVSCFATEGKTYAEMRAHFDLFALPEYVMDRACFPNSYYLSEQEAFRIAYEEIGLITGLQYFDIVEFCNVYSTAELVTFPLVTNHPVWIVRIKGHLLPDESRIATYVIAISAVDRTMWFVFDAQNAIYSKINDSLCVDGIAINALPQLGAPFHWQTILPQLNEN